MKRRALIPAVMILFAGVMTGSADPPTATTRLKKGFVYVGETVPGIHIECRYFSEDNFVGRRVDGYEAAKCILTRQAADALVKVQEDLKPFGLSLKIFDGYRPQRAVDHFVRWAKDLKNQETKEEYYPNVLKRDLIGDYIAPRSGHTRGSSVDVTLISLDGEELDMGSAFDFFDKKSWTHERNITTAQRAHRMLLRSVMTKHGFKPYKFEWWHFTLAKEPFPETYFDFPVK